MTFLSDFLVIGSGIAGLSYALQAAKHGTVHLITKKESAESNTNYAQGGIAAVIDPKDSYDEHIQDTLIAGDGLCDQEAVQILVSEGPERIKELINLGVEFSRKNGKLSLGKEGGHSKSRILHAKDLTGKEIERALLYAVKTNPNIHVFEHRQAIDLITEHHLSPNHPIKNPTCFGAYVLNTLNGQIDVFSSKIVYLSSGGAGQVYLHTTNPKIATGDGMVMAWRAGARVANLEFMQFHPTALFTESPNRFLISEAVRGHGAILLNKKGERFMKRYDSRMELATRDIVARAIDNEMKLHGDEFVLLDISHIPAKNIKSHFPNIYKKCLEVGFDLTKGPVPVVPAAHYMCGGVVVDYFGHSDINNLYIGGETAMTGVHGANRLASNSLLEALVWSYRSVEKAKENLSSIPILGFKIPEWNDKGTSNPEEWVLVKHDFNEIKSIMWDYVGIVRSNLRLERAKRRIELISKEVYDFYRRSTLNEEIVELRNLSILAKLIIDSAIARKESRGLHFNTDYPEKVNETSVRNTTLTPKLKDYGFKELM